MVMMKTTRFWLAIATAFAVASSSAFTTRPVFSTTSTVTKTSLFIGPLQKIANKKEYDKTVAGLMKTKGLTREQAEKDYNEYLDNPTNYALNKGEQYYKSLGYNSLMEGVIGEAEKEGRGDEVRARIEKFQKESKLKGLATISFFILLGAYAKFMGPPPPGTY